MSPSAAVAEFSAQRIMASWEQPFCEQRSAASRAQQVRLNRDALARRQMTMQGRSEGSAEAYLTYAAQATKRVTPQRRLDPKPGVPV